MVLRSLATCVCTRYGFHFTVLLISFAPPYYAHSYANHWSVAQRLRQRQKANGKWGKTAIKKVAAPAYASSLRCRILKCPCELSTGFSPHNPAKKPVRRGGRPDPDADDVGGGGGVSMSSLTTRGMDPRMLYGVVVIILAVVVVVVVAIGTVLLFRLVLALLYYNSALSIPYQI